MICEVADEGACMLVVGLEGQKLFVVVLNDLVLVLGLGGRWQLEGHRHTAKLRDVGQGVCELAQTESEAGIEKCLKALVEE